LSILPAWREYAAKVEKIRGKGPQISPAFSQAYCCWQFGLVQNLGDGVDAFKINASGKVLHRVEIKATTSPQGRNDIKVFPKKINAVDRLNLREEYAIDFDELYWLAFSNRKLIEYSIYRVLPQQIFDYYSKHSPEIRGGLINVSFSQLVKESRVKVIKKRIFKD
jgi:hypothetical protein